MNYTCVIVCYWFFQKPFPGTRIVISSEVRQKFHKIPSLITNGHACHFENDIRHFKIYIKIENLQHRVIICDLPGKITILKYFKYLKNSALRNEHSSNSWTFLESVIFLKRYVFPEFRTNFRICEQFWIFWTYFRNSWLLFWIQWHFVRIHEHFLDMRTIFEIMKKNPKLFSQIVKIYLISNLL